MRIQIMSDLHLQHWGKGSHTTLLEETRTNADVLVLAGDIIDLRPGDLRWSMVRMGEFCARYPQVVFVPGNHEFYGTGIDSGMAELPVFEREFSNLTVLRPGEVRTVLGQRFLGGTMWYPRAPGGTMRITDHRAIRDVDPVAFQEHKRFRGALDKLLRAGDIVVSHHTPSTKSIPEEFADSDTNHWFCVPAMEEVIVERQPAMWIHGHTHSPFDYRIGTTRVLCNPRGYPGEGVPFNPKFVVELS